MLSYPRSLEAKDLVMFGLHSLVCSVGGVLYVECQVDTEKLLAQFLVEFKIVSYC
jgi:hypothetical protein